MWKFFNHEGNKQWVKALRLFVEVINESINRTIKARPTDVNKDNQHEVFMTLYSQPVHLLPPKFHVGNLARVAKYESVLRPQEKRDKLIFKKGYCSRLIQHCVRNSVSLTIKDKTKFENVQKTFFFARAHCSGYVT